MMQLPLVADDYAYKGQYQLTMRDGYKVTITRKVQAGISPVVDQLELICGYKRAVENFAEKTIVLTPVVVDNAIKEDEDPFYEIEIVDDATNAKALAAIEEEIARRETGSVILSTPNSWSWWDALGITWLTSLVSNLGNYSMETLQATRTALAKKVYG